MCVCERIHLKLLHACFMIIICAKKFLFTVDMVFIFFPNCGLLRFCACVCVCMWVFSCSMINLPLFLLFLLFSHFLSFSDFFSSSSSLLALSSALCSFAAITSREKTLCHTIIFICDIRVAATNFLRPLASNGRKEMRKTVPGEWQWHNLCTLFTKELTEKMNLPEILKSLREIFRCARHCSCTWGAFNFSWILKNGMQDNENAYTSADCTQWR